MSGENPVFTVLASLADPQRARMLRLLEREELAVGELASALQLAQSTMCRHLKALFDAGLVVKRAEGTATLYRLSPEALSADARAAWTLVRNSLGESATHAGDDLRLAEVLAARHHHTAAVLHAGEVGVPVAGERALGAPACRGVERALGHGCQGCQRIGRRVGPHGQGREHQRGGGAQQQLAADTACRPRLDGWG